MQNVFQPKYADRSILPRNLCHHKSMDRESSFCKNLKTSFTYIMHKEYVLYYASIQININWFHDTNIIVILYMHSYKIF